MAFHKVIYAKCPYCKEQLPWATFAANDQFSSGIEKMICPSCKEIVWVKATNIMKFTARKTKG